MDLLIGRRVYRDGKLRGRWSRLQNFVYGYGKSAHNTVASRGPVSKREPYALQIPSADDHRQQFLGSVDPVAPRPLLEFEPCASDNILDIRRSCANDPTLASEAKTWISSLIRAQKMIDETTYKLSQLEKMARYADDLVNPGACISQLLVHDCRGF